MKLIFLNGVFSLKKGVLFVLLHEVSSLGKNASSEFPPLGKHSYLVCIPPLLLAVEKDGVTSVTSLTKHSFYRDKPEVWT